MQMFTGNIPVNVLTKICKTITLDGMPSPDTINIVRFKFQCKMGITLDVQSVRKVTFETPTPSTESNIKDYEQVINY